MNSIFSNSANYVISSNYVINVIIFNYVKTECERRKRITIGTSNFEDKLTIALKYFINY